MPSRRRPLLDAACAPEAEDPFEANFEIDASDPAATEVSCRCCAWSGTWPLWDASEMALRHLEAAHPPRPAPATWRARLRV